MTTTRAVFLSLAIAAMVLLIGVLATGDPSFRGGPTPMVDRVGSGLHLPLEGGR
jgi:hypothetical protein